MPSDHTDDASIVATLSSASRATPWTLVDATSLHVDAYHPQGMTRIGSTWWVSTVDVERRRGFVLAIDDHGDLVERVPVGDHRRYHPGGMDFDGTALWIAVAEYRPDSSASIVRLVPGCSPEPVFDVADHVGAIARCGAEADLVGWSWGSRTFSRWSIDGQLLHSRSNPGFFVDYQDCQWLDTGHLLCGGVASVQLSATKESLGGIGLLRADTLQLERELPFPGYSAASGRVATHNPIWSEVRGDDLIVHLLPDDGESAILSYSTPLVRA